MTALILDIIHLETSTQANDLFYMCKLMQLVLNVDQIRRDWIAAGNKRTLGIAAVGALYGVADRTFQNWHTWGTRFLHLCCAGTMHILVIIASLSMRTCFTKGYKNTTNDINSLAEVLREVAERRWGLLVRHLISVVHYLRGISIPVLDNYHFVRGEDDFTFNSTIDQVDKILESIQTNLMTLPPPGRSLGCESIWPLDSFEASGPMSRS
ncbi:hypothetical protein DFH07DRAFT_50917 [Mycena maculata]|uniref:Uncharacterized protein n=1 Tax=Mycena maculata TaxID=230809 RepID=A0AAD7IHH9_9AGAR|nr:hypothetical protein DFH07DRAFT_50917 [Mycena maculata]